MDTVGTTLHEAMTTVAEERTLQMLHSAGEFDVPEATSTLAASKEEDLGVAIECLEEQRKKKVKVNSDVTRDAELGLRSSVGNTAVVEKKKKKTRRGGEANRKMRKRQKYRQEHKKQKKKKSKDNDDSDKSSEVSMESLPSLMSVEDSDSDEDGEFDGHDADGGDLVPATGESNLTRANLVSSHGSNPSSNPAYNSAL